jgi:hypothetical protein
VSDLLGSTAMGCTTGFRLDFWRANRCLTGTESCPANGSPGGLKRTSIVFIKRVEQNGFKFG